jgi:hypothetical protein
MGANYEGRGMAVFWFACADRGGVDLGDMEYLRGCDMRNIWKAFTSAVNAGLHQWRRVRYLQRRTKRFVDEWDGV